MDDKLFRTKVGQQIKASIERERTKRMMVELSKALGEKITFWDLGFKEPTDYSILTDERYNTHITTHYFIFYKGKKYVFINEMIEKITMTQERNNYNAHVSSDRIRTFFQKDFVRYPEITNMFGSVRLITDNIIEIEQFNMVGDDIMSIKKMTTEDYNYIKSEMTKVLSMESESNLAYTIESIETLCKVNGEIKVYDIDDFVDRDKLDSNIPFFVNDNKCDIHELYIFDNKPRQNIIDYVRNYYCSDGSFTFDNLQTEQVQDGLIKLFNK